MMKTVTVDEFVKAVQGQNIEIYDFEVAAGITVSMSKVRVELYAPENEVIFTSGNHVTDGLGSLSIKEELIDCIDFDEEEQRYLFSLDNGTEFTVEKVPVIEEKKPDIGHACAMVLTPDGMKPVL